MHYIKSIVGMSSKLINIENYYKIYVDTLFKDLQCSDDDDYCRSVLTDINNCLHKNQGFSNLFTIPTTVENNKGISNNLIRKYTKLIHAEYPYDMNHYLTKCMDIFNRSYTEMEIINKFTWKINKFIMNTDIYIYSFIYAGALMYSYFNFDEFEKSIKTFKTESNFDKYLFKTMVIFGIQNLIATKINTCLNSIYFNGSAISQSANSEFFNSCNTVIISNTNSLVDKGLKVLTNIVDSSLIEFNDIKYTIDNAIYIDQKHELYNCKNFKKLTDKLFFTNTDISSELLNAIFHGVLVVFDLCTHKRVIVPMNNDKIEMFTYGLTGFGVKLYHDLILPDDLANLIYNNVESNTSGSDENSDIVLN